MRGHLPGLTAAPSQAWRRYDTDRSGYIEANELKVGCERGGRARGRPRCHWGVTSRGTARSLSPQGFLSDLLKKANRPYDEPKLQEYTQTIVGGSRSGGTPPAWPHRGWEGARSHRCPPGGALRRQGVTGGRLCPAAADVRHERGREAGALRDVPVRPRGGGEGHKAPKTPGGRWLWLSSTPRHPPEKEKGQGGTVRASPIVVFKKKAQNLRSGRAMSGARCPLCHRPTPHCAPVPSSPHPARGSGMDSAQN